MCIRDSIDTEDALIEQLKVEKESDIRVLIGLALYRMDSEKGMNELQKLALKDENPRVKRMSSAIYSCLLYTSPSPRDRTRSRMPSSA